MIVIAHPGHRRIGFLQEALLAAGLPAAEVLAWSDVLGQPGLLTQRVAREPGAWIKIESPGEDAATTLQLIQNGWRALQRSGPEPQSFEHGELAWRDCWYAGFVGSLATLAHATHGVQARWLNAPGDIALMGDKLACQQHLLEAGIEVPHLLGAVSSYDELREMLREHDMDRVYLKARYGSSAAGVVAYQRNHLGQEIAFSTAYCESGLATSRVFNRLLPTRLTNRRSIANLIDVLAKQGTYVEQWVPKPRVPGSREEHYDVRMVVCAGRARQRVARISRGPLTNLHLGNRRAPADPWLTAEEIAAMEDAALSVASGFPDSHVVALDMIPRGNRSFVLEVNAFGDLLPGALCANSSTYDDQAALFSATGAERG